VKNEEVVKIANLRKYVIECHNALKHRNTDTAMVKQSDVAYEFAQIIKGLDDVLKPHVNFE
tara:strand:+ start:292 stop:474 length:183 start_codon:yes stop_codon:yes gene_type:complete